MASEDAFACEACDAVTPDEEGVQHGDVTLCPKCSEAWQAEFAACEHSWEPDSGGFDHGYSCRLCGGFVTDEQFADLFPDTPNPAAAR